MNNQDTATRRAAARHAVAEHLRLTAAGSTDEWVELFAPDAVLEFPFAPTGVPRQVSGRDALREHMKSVPDTFGVTFVDLVFHETVDPSLVIAEFRSTGTALPTGNPYEQTWINEPGRVFVARHGRSELTTTILHEGQVRDLVEKMLKTTGRRIDLSTPFVDAMLPDGSRLHVVIPDLAQAPPLASLTAPIWKCARTGEVPVDIRGSPSRLWCHAADPRPAVLTLGRLAQAPGALPPPVGRTPAGDSGKVSVGAWRRWWRTRRQMSRRQEQDGGVHVTAGPPPVAGPREPGRRRLSFASSGSPSDCHRRLTTSAAGQDHGALNTF